MARWIARRDRAAGVPLELVVPAEAEVARDGKEPPGDALGVGERIPDLGGRGGVAAFGHDHPGRLSLPGRVPDLTADGIDGGEGIHQAIIPGMPYISPER